MITIVFCVFVFVCFSYDKTSVVHYVLALFFCCCFYCIPLYSTVFYSIVVPEEFNNFLRQYVKRHLFHNHMKTPVYVRRLYIVIFFLRFLNYIHKKAKQM